MNIKRMRGRGHRGNGGGFRQYGGGTPINRNHVFESNGPDVRLRGTAQQLFEKYLQLGRDANSAGDRVTGESYFQHAEHYFRILNAINQAQAQSQQNGFQNGLQGRVTEESTDPELVKMSGTGTQASESQPLEEAISSEVQTIPISVGSPTD